MVVPAVGDSAVGGVCVGGGLVFWCFCFLGLWHFHYGLSLPFAPGGWA